jgi:hypothetical protein
MKENDGYVSEFNFEGSVHQQNILEACMYVSLVYKTSGVQDK